MRSMTSVLIVDDEPAVRDIMARWVSSLGLQSKTASSADEALATEMHRDHPHTAVVIATAYTSLLDSERQPPPVADLLIKPFQRERFALALDRGLQWRKQALDEVRWQSVLSAEIRDRSREISSDLRARATADTEIAVLTQMIAEAVPDVMRHGERVARFALSVARELSLALDARRLLELAARFHDVGKTAMPHALLAKPSPLTSGELVIMRRHVDIGADIMMSTRTLTDLAPIVRATHESFGGSGYPRRLRGGEIPLASRIITVIDAYDAMTEERQHHVAVDSGEAITELLRCSGTQFDPDVLGAFLSVLSRH